MLKRFAIACEGGLVGAALVAAVEARNAAPTASAVFVADWAVLAPVAIAISLATCAVHIYFEPNEARGPAEILADIRAESVLTRSRAAAIFPLGIASAFFAMLALSHVARAALARGAPAAVGIELAGASVAALFLGAVVSLALTPPLRRALAHGADRMPRLVDPIFTGGIALVLAVVAFSYGAHVGDAGGDGPTMLAIFGVLGRAELDLRPLLDAIAIAACAYLFPVALARGRRANRAAIVAVVVTLASIVWTSHEAHALNSEKIVTRSLEHAPFGRMALAGLRKGFDHDHDGSSALFGGGDCNDRDAKINPLAFDIPGNGIDEDCSGADTPIPPPPPPPPPPPKVSLPKDLNVILITIDTLRLDVGFAGYDKPTTPNLDALAEKSTVFDRAYSLASYTGKSVGPLLIGKYPSETDRDGGHFNKYAPANTFLAERLHHASIRTFGAASHWYFAPWSGLSQGMDEWDMSAKPSEGQGENDTSITSDKLSDAAIRLLGKSENTSGRFFMWLHYFDPHAQYMPHSGAPNFLGDNHGGAAFTRALYDGEVWFTDKHVGRVLDFIASEPWGAHTVIVVTSDHGEAFGEHNMSWHGADLWEVLVRVPLLIYVPGADAHHVTEKRSHIDLVPTLLDLYGIERPGSTEISGRSFIADLVTKGPYEERDVYMDMPIGPYTMMRKAFIYGKTPGMKLIWAGGTNYQLYDLANDPDEKNDLSSDAEKLAPIVKAFEIQRARSVEIEVKPDAP